MADKGLAVAPSKLPRISMSRKGETADGDQKKTLTSSSSGSGGGAGGGAPGRKSKVAGKSRSMLKSRAQSAMSMEEISVPAYLDPQPKYYKDTWKEDMVIERFDPLADSDEEEPVVEEAFTTEYDDDFDYEKLYMEDPSKGGDDYDDYAREAERPSVGHVAAPEGAAEEEEEGDEEEGEGEDEQIQAEQAAAAEVDEQNLEECDDRSDDEIAQERLMKQLYETAFADIMALTVTREVEAEAPSITEKSLEEYFQDREEDKIQKFQGEYSGWFYTEGSEVLHRRKILACLDSILLKERLKYRSIKEDFTKRWEMGQAKQVTIDGALIKFDSYYRETLGKRNRAIQQTTHEMSQRLEKMREVNRNKKELECLLKLQRLCEKRLERFRIFERYLERVRDASHGEFSDIRDIIDRYGVLSQARNALISRDVRNQDKTDRAQNALKRNMELRSNELLVYNNYLSELRVYRDNIYEEILQLEEMLLHIKTTAAERTLLIGKIKMAINNLYLGLCKQLGRAGKIPAEDTLRQLHYIRGSMKEIIKLSRDVKKMLMAAAQAAEREKKEHERKEQEARRRKYRFAKGGHRVNDYAALFGFKREEDA